MTKGNMTTFQIQQRFSLIKTFASVVIALIIAFLLMMLKCDRPFEALLTFITGPLTSWSRFCGMLNKLTPLLFTSSAVCMMFACGQFNLAAESAFFLGGVMSTVISVLPGIPAGVHFILVALFSMVIGAVVCFIPAIMHVRFKAVMFVAALMLNYVVRYLVTYLMTNPLRDPTAGFEATRKIAESAKLPALLTGAATKVHIGLIIGLAVVVFTFYLIYKTPFGQNLRTVGSNRNFALFSGIPVGGTIIATCLIGGAMCGLGGAVEVCGIYRRLNWEASPGFGWDGVMIAMIAHNNPKFIPFAALFLAYVRTSSEVLSMSFSIPTEIVSIIQAIVISFIAASAFLQGWEHKTIIKNSQALAAKSKEV